MKSLVAIALLGLLAAGCARDANGDLTGALSGSAEKDVVAALALACPIAAVSQSVVPQNAKSQAAYGVLVSVCPPNPPPTSAIVAAADILNAYLVLKPLVK